MDNNFEKAVLGGGCFWGIEYIFSHLKGVKSVIAGYSGGMTIDPTYEQIHSAETGHAETVEILFNPKVISFEDLLHIFFLIHDPTALNRQGHDIGTPYRSIILYMNEGQKEIAERVIKETNEKKVYKNPIVTEIAPFKEFYQAEGYHQKYFEKSPEKIPETLLVKMQKVKDNYPNYYK